VRLAGAAAAAGRLFPESGVPIYKGQGARGGSCLLLVCGLRTGWARGAACFGRFAVSAAVCGVRYAYEWLLYA
jgi:hypothetical protein